MFNKASQTVSLERIPGRDSNRLKERIFYDDRETGLKVCVESDFVSDLASIPAICRVIASNDDFRLVRPSLLHDWIYRHKGRLGMFTFNSKAYPRVRLKRSQADKLFYNALRCEGVSGFKSFLMWLAVRTVGWRYWG